MYVVSGLTTWTTFGYRAAHRTATSNLRLSAWQLAWNEKSFIKTHGLASSCLHPRVIISICTITINIHPYHYHHYSLLQTSSSSLPVYCQSMHSTRPTSSPVAARTPSPVRRAILSIFLDVKLVLMNPMSERSSVNWHLRLAIIYKGNKKERFWARSYTTKLVKNIDDSTCHILVSFQKTRSCRLSIKSTKSNPGCVQNLISTPCSYGSYKNLKVFRI